MNFKFKIVNDLSELSNWYTDKPIFCDIETDGLYTDVRMIQMYQPEIDDNIYIYDVAHIGYDKSKYKDKIEVLRNYLLNLHTVWYNASYDLGTLNISPSLNVTSPDTISEDTVYDKRVDDLIYAIKIAYHEFKEFGLKSVVTKLRYTKDMYRGIDTKKVVTTFSLGSYISHSAYTYAAKDVYSLSLMWKDKRIQHVIQNNMAYKVDMISQAYAMVYQQNGLVLNREMWKKEVLRAENEVVKYRKLLPRGFNPNSFKQVRSLLKSTESDKKALIGFIAEGGRRGEDAKNVMYYKRAIKQRSYLKSINYNKVYTKFNVYGTVTGRFNSKGGDLEDGINAQQIPRYYQYLFKSPTKDTSVVDADYSTVELRLAAAIYNEPEMAKIFKEGRDPHLEVAADTSGKKIHPSGKAVEQELYDAENISDSEFVTTVDRTKAKGVNFGFVFGMSSKTFQEYAFNSYGTVYTESEAKDVRLKYFTKFPGFKKFHKYTWNNYKDPKFVAVTALGRKVSPKMGTDAINTPVQGSGAECIKLAIHYLVKDYTPYVLRYIYNIVHDAIYLRVPAGTEQYWSDALVASMTKAWTEICKTYLFKIKDIPIKAEPEVHIYGEAC